VSQSKVTILYSILINIDSWALLQVSSSASPSFAGSAPLSGIERARSKADTRARWYAPYGKTSILPLQINTPRERDRERQREKKLINSQQHRSNTYSSHALKRRHALLPRPRSPSLRSPRLETTCCQGLAEADAAGFC
jgi:hypothetical protein